MDGTQYDLFLALLSDYELGKHEDTLLQAERMSRHQGVGSEDFLSELAAIAAEKQRRIEERVARGTGDF
jgi:hypothetical protein